MDTQVPVPVLPLPEGIWTTNERPYFHNKSGPLNKFRRDLPWGVPTEVIDSKSSNIIAEDEGLEVNDLLGDGSYSSVYRGYWKPHKQHVAVKIYEKPRSSQESPTLPALKKVAAEVEALKSLKHPNIMGFFGAMETKYRIYLVLELVERGNLLTYLKSAGPAGDSPQSQKWFAQLLSAVTYMHRNEIAHRDIKCENILLDKELNIRLSDFGFAIPNMTWYKDCSNNVFTKIEEFCGSLAYMAPEIVKKVAYCPILSDVWSMGVVLYAMIFAKFPFEQVTVENIIGLAGKFRPIAPIASSLEDIFKSIFEPEKKRIRSYQLLDKKWIELQVDAVFLGKMAELNQDDAEKSLKYNNRTISEGVLPELVT